MHTREKLSSALDLSRPRDGVLANVNGSIILEIKQSALCGQGQAILSGKGVLSQALLIPGFFKTPLLSGRALVWLVDRAAALS